MATWWGDGDVGTSVALYSGSRSGQLLLLNLIQHTQYTQYSMLPSARLGADGDGDGDDAESRG